MSNNVTTSNNNLPSQSPAPLPPVPLDQILVLINRYIKSTGIFLNDFALLCDTRLNSVSQKINKLSMEVMLLETKFHHHQEESKHIENEISQTSSSAETLTVTVEPPVLPPAPQKQSKSTNTDSRLQPAPSVQLQQSPTESRLQSAQPQQSTPMTAATKDPRLQKYLSMLKVGIPKDAVILKMQMDGVGELAGSI
jgi:hypothetical protein